MAKSGMSFLSFSIPSIRRDGEQKEQKEAVEIFIP